MMLTAPTRCRCSSDASSSRTSSSGMSMNVLARVNTSRMAGRATGRQLLQGCCEVDRGRDGASCMASSIGMVASRKVGRRVPARLVDAVGRTVGLPFSSSPTQQSGHPGALGAWKEAPWTRPRSARTSPRAELSLFRTACLLCGDPHRAEDIVQDALARLYGVWDRVSRMDNVDGYVRRIIVNAHYSDRRRPWVA